MPTEISRLDIAAMVDHTLLKPEATAQDVRALVRDAQDLGVPHICVSPSMLPLSDTGDLVVAVVAGFPSGKHHSSVKAAEARLAVEQGAREVDMVIDVGAAIEGRYDDVEADVAAVREAMAPDAALKVIIESAALLASPRGEEAVVECCRAAERAGAQFVKTSTGFHPAGGASEEAVRLMAQTVDGRLGVKASGGIRDARAARAMIAAGATRLGLSATREVLDGADG
ncbi:deoxyribose-phosphate aldolase [Marmoricola endophyticus]|uniref:Deoxyribose-phosphate aldolase n=1 Tax=Marmoricola endophyticus TaxID=2040280 RepID=A0A917BGY2_9ACTN|nr:deoxyribose-phosphate aldolase [Marmoricola endophyticus]GGF40621.1 deoxyribose-phosphate aldolase [Marmoricola endophyticus]